MDIQHVLSVLAKKRPIFHNEADFQHSLAWELRQHYEGEIRLEKRLDLDPKRRTYLDIMLEIEGRRIAIELKYKMRALEHTVQGETFSLLNQGAQDIGRYDVLKDLQRLEQMVKKNLADEGYLIFLTNDTSYCIDPGMNKSTFDRDFRIHEGREISGVLSWSEGTGHGTMKGREEPILIEGSYLIRWKPYSQLDDSVQGSIQSLLLKADPQAVPKVEIPAAPELPEIQQPAFPMVDEHHEIPDDRHGINQYIRSINEIPVSQMDLRDKLIECLKTDGFHTQINRDFGRHKVDIWAEKDDQKLAIEVRYKTALLQTIHHGKDVNLKNQAAQDISRYDYLKDVEKLESVISSRSEARGYAILITNDHTYWQKSNRSSSVDEQFRIDEGRTIHGQLQWRNASGGTTHNREDLINIRGVYDAGWQPFIATESGKNNTFKLLVLEVKSDYSG
ncbi:hypothetical protein ACP26L_32005 [Paenibacillus sp. S-38]|uniref:hypothetical protein n=1 Tax=Paenibacillus sp. S-38 TaxID=3416710 RepID=UPI003CEF6B9E